MSDIKIIPDGVDGTAAAMALAWYITSYYYSAYTKENDIKGNLLRAMKVYSAVHSCISLGTEIDPKIFDGMI